MSEMIVTDIKAIQMLGISGSLRKLLSKQLFSGICRGLPPAAWISRFMTLSQIFLLTTTSAVIRAAAIRRCFV
ncbi:hypothetical protein WP12_14460 [Sphingomonas sp. SRS2]|nr:hypothetical protein WP12_14460 [Sphingomonas sp. SRS2]